MTKDFEPYLPMDAVVTDDPPPAGEFTFKGPLSLGALISESARLFKRHWGWCSALLTLPYLATMVGSLNEILNVNNLRGWISSQSLSFFIGLPLSISASGAFYWRLLGSAVYGQLQRGPIMSMFLGFRFFLPLFLVGLAILGVAIALSIVPITLYFTLLMDGETTPSLASSPAGWLAFSAAALCSLLGWLVIYSRLAVAIPIAIAENRPVVLSMKMSISLTKGRFGTVLVFAALLFLVGFVSSMALSVALHNAVGGATVTVLPEWRLWMVPIQLLLNILFAVLHGCGVAALYRLVRVSTSPSAEHLSAKVG